MRLYYWKKPGSGNFGDELNPLIWPKLLPDVFSSAHDSIFLGIGTLLNRTHRFPPQSVKYVFGSGVGYGLRPLRLDASWRIYCVRGPLSSDALGLRREMAITDSALLIRKLIMPADKKDKTHATGFIPHHLTADIGGPNWLAVCRELEILYIDPRDPPQQVIERIKSVGCLIAEAMHGAVVADALRVPWTAAVIGQEINSFKWLDWCASMSVPYRPQYVCPLYQDYGRPAKGQMREITELIRATAESLKNASNATGTLSDDAVWQRQSERLEKRLVELRNDLEKHSTPHDER